MFLLISGLHTEALCFDKITVRQVQYGTFSSGLPNFIQVNCFIFAMTFHNITAYGFRFQFSRWKCLGSTLASFLMRQHRMCAICSDGFKEMTHNVCYMLGWVWWDHTECVLYVRMGLKCIGKNCIVLLPKHATIPFFHKHVNTFLTACTFYPTLKSQCL